MAMAGAIGHSVSKADFAREQAEFKPKQDLDLTKPVDATMGSTALVPQGQAKSGPPDADSRPGRLNTRA